MYGPSGVRDLAHMPVCMQIEPLRAIIATLPVCWTIRDGVLVQDRPVTPGMTLYYAEVVWIVFAVFRTGKLHVVRKDGRGNFHGVRNDAGEYADSPEAAAMAKEQGDA